jgi:general secretion pathway protein I
MTPSPHREAGFTLLETLVAFAIAAIALAVLYRGAVDGLVGAHQADRTEEAVARTRSRLAALCHGAQLAPGQRSGDDGGGYRWRTDITRVDSVVRNRGSADAEQPPERVDLFAVRVVLSWPGTLRPHQVVQTSRCLSMGDGERL